MSATAPNASKQEPDKPTAAPPMGTGGVRRGGRARTRAAAVMGPSRLALTMATVLVGLSAGFFFTYEASVTLGLAEVSDVAYVETFQAINDTVRNPAFGIVFFGSVPALGMALVANWRSAPAMGRGLLLAALPLYLAGVLITVTGNVPLNDDLANVASLTDETAAAARAAFEEDWNRLNLIRGLAVAAGFVSLAAASIMIPTGDQGADGTTRQTG